MIDDQKKLLEKRMDQMHTYHNHKEMMGHAAFLLLLGFTILLIKIDNWPPDWIKSIQIEISRNVLAAFFAYFFAACFYIYIRWQLINKRISSIYVTAILNTLKMISTDNYNNDSMQPYQDTSMKNKRYKTFLNFLFPLRTEYINADEGFSNYPSIFVKELLKIIEEKKYSLWSERLITFICIINFIILTIFLFWRN